MADVKAHAAGYQAAIATLNVGAAYDEGEGGDRLAFAARWLEEQRRQPNQGSFSLGEEGDQDNAD